MPKYKIQAMRLYKLLGKYDLNSNMRNGVEAFSSSVKNISCKKL